MRWLFVFLQGCCCCPCWPTPGAKEVPVEQLAMVADWICTDGARWTFRPDGTYSHRTADRVYDDGIVVAYAGSHWSLGADSFLDDVVSETTLTVEAPDGSPCATIGQRVCARADAGGVPPELVGIWTLGGQVLEVRADGYGRYRASSAATWTGGALHIGAEVRLQVCAEDLLLPLAVANGGLALDGVEMTHTDPQFDEETLEADRHRRSAVPDSTRGTHRRPSFDFD
ncbi:MAG: hypothetical protein ABMA64_38775 [Myxococcota bacterium]